MEISRRHLLQAGLAASALTFTGQILPAEGDPLNSYLPTRGPLPDVSHGPRNTKQVALTFHGAGDPVLARRILAEAKNASIGISVMAVGSWLVSFPEFAKQIVSAGHDLGNHTMTHQAMKHLSATHAHNEIVRCAAELQKLIGNQGKWFRPSGTPTSNATIRQAAFDNGYPFCVTYNLDSLDYLDPKESVVVNAVLKHVRAGDIISMHLGHAVTTKALPKIIEGLTARKLAPVTLTKLLKG